MAEKKKTVEAAAPAADKKKALETAMAQIEKTYGKGSIMRLGDNSRVQVESIPTGSLALDLALGIGGVPRGRIVEIYGPESSGKTTLALHIAAEAQKRGGEVAFIDAEHALDPVYARALGVNIDNMLISQPDTGEQGLEICEALVRSGALDVIVVDSVAALVPQAEIVGDMGDSHVGLLARLMSQALRKLAGSISKTHCVVIFINQLREKVGVVYGNPEVTTGGRALKFYSSVRIDVRRVEGIKSGTELIGNHTRAKVVKNKVAPPFREAEFDIMYGEGISKYGEMVDLAVKLDIIQKSGSWFSMGEERIGQGRDSAKKYLKDNPEICERVEAEIRQNSFKLMSAQSQAAARAAGRAPQEETEAQGEAQEAAPEEAVPLPEEPPEGKPEGKLTVPKGVDVSADDFDDDAP
ncbi:MAG: recombinase RecA [Ruminiclostridium sp.]|nr:recombinase RecA [Ruminiclostridium sp.]